MVTIVSWLTLKVLKKEDFFLPKNILYPYALLLAWMVISFVNIDSELAYKGIRGFLKWIEYLGFFVIAAEILSQQKMRRKFICIFFLSMTLVTINGFFQLWHGTDFLRQVSLDPGRITRMKSSLGSPNNLAGFYLLSLPLVFHQVKKFFDEKNKFFILHLILFLFFASAFICTFSRSAFVGLVFSISFYLVIKNWRLSILFFIFLLILLGFSATLRSNFITSLNFNDITVNERLYQWQACWKLFKEHPVLGHGINTFYRRLPTLQLASGPYRGYAHNSYLQMAVELGFVGVLLFMAPLITGLKKFLRDRNSNFNDALWVGLLAYLVQAFFDNNFYAMQSAFLFWFFWAFYFRTKAESAIPETPVPYDEEHHKK